MSLKAILSVSTMSLELAMEISDLRWERRSFCSKKEKERERGKERERDGGRDRERECLCVCARERERERERGEKKWRVRERDAHRVRGDGKKEEMREWFGNYEREGRRRD